MAAENIITFAYTITSAATGTVLYADLEAASESIALDAYAVEAGYESFVGLAYCLDQTLAEARADLIVTTTTIEMRFSRVV